MSRIRIVAIAAVAALSLSMIQPKTAEARDAGRIIAGVALGAVATGLLQGYGQRSYGYPYGYANRYSYGYAPAPTRYYAPAPYRYYGPAPAYYYAAPSAYHPAYNRGNRNWRQR